MIMSYFSHRLSERMSIDDKRRKLTHRVQFLVFIRMLQINTYYNAKIETYDITKRNIMIQENENSLEEKSSLTVLSHL